MIGSNRRREKTKTKQLYEEENTNVRANNITDNDVY